MQDSLYEFLILNRKINLPGIGTISLQQDSSLLDFGNKELTPPSYYFIMESASDKPSKKLLDWLSSSRNISEWDAIKSVNDFSFSLKEKLSEAGEVVWQKVGTFRRDSNGNLKLDSQLVALKSQLPVVAEKLMRENVLHTILVGEQEKSSAEMEEYFAETPATRNYAWLIAVILTVLAIMFVGWYFSEKGFAPSSVGNQSVIKSN